MQRRFIVWGMLLVLVLGIYPSTPAHASTLPSGFVESVYADGFNSPTTMRFAPDGRLFVLEQDGAVWVVDTSGNVLPDPFIDIDTDDFFERGLLGIAFDPNFASNQYIYLYYTVPDPTRYNLVSRFTADGNEVVPGSELPIMDLDPLNAGNHNGGAINFGDDGMLYIAVGDNANSSNAQTLNNRHGKMLRINADGSIPSDNPFFGSATGDNRAIWALGLRNPFNFTVQPGTGTIFLNDVGQSTWEEINQGTAGANYGWPATEGDFDPGTFPQYTRPLYAYNHSGGACSITGAAFYNPTTATFPADYVGDYFFGDYCANWIRRYDVGTDTAIPFATNLTGTNMVDIVIGEEGDLYYLSRGSGAVHRVQYVANPEPPTIVLDPEDVTVGVGGDATFTCDATGSPPLEFQWQRDQVDIGDATDNSYTLEDVTLGDDGALFRCVVTNDFGSDTSEEALLTVLDDVAPVAEITSPANGSFYNAGDTIIYSGTGTDEEDGDLPASAFTWEVVFHHDTHTHPFIPPFSGVTSGEFVIPTVGHTETNVWYRIHLTVVDSLNVTHSVYHDIFPNVVTLTVDTVPPGLEITVDGQPFDGPYTTDSVVGVIRTLGAPSPQTVGDTTYVFQSWSDGGSATHDISTPGSDTTYTANFLAVDINELLVNGGFEDDTNGDNIPDEWVNKKDFAAAKQKCNKDKDGDGVPDKIVANGGECAFQTKGVGSNGKLQQTVDSTGMVAGSLLDLSFWVFASNAADGARVDVTVKYDDGTKEKIQIDLTAGSYEYQEFGDTLTLSGDATKVKARIRNATIGGKYRLDDMSLLAYTPVESRSNELIPLPPVSRLDTRQ